MIRIGLIGDIASGKSFIAKLFNSPIFNADEEVKYLYKNSKICFYNLKRKLPKFIKSFPIKKIELTTAIKTNNNNLKKISSVVHPLVRKRMKAFLKENNKSKIIILDIPLLVENKLHKKNDILIFINSSKKNILSRLSSRKKYDKNLLKTLKQNQLILSKKIGIADYIVDNNYSPYIMKKKVKLLKRKILNERNNS